MQDFKIQKATTDLADADSIEKVTSVAKNITKLLTASSTTLLEIKSVANGEGIALNSQIDIINDAPDEFLLQKLFSLTPICLSLMCEDLSSKTMAYTWQEEKAGWAPAHVALKSDTSNGNTTLCVLAPLQDNKFAALVIDDMPTQNLNDNIDDIHRLSTILLESFLSIKSEQNNSILNKIERQCLLWIACGKTKDEIANILSLSVHNITDYCNLINSKLGTKVMPHAVAKAIKKGEINLVEID